MANEYTSVLRRVQIETVGVIPTPLLLTVEERNQLQLIGGSYIGGVRKLLATEYHSRYALIMAFARGGQSRKDGKDEAANPYPTDSMAALSWEHGWERRDIEERKDAALRLAATALESCNGDMDVFNKVAMALGALRELGYGVHSELPVSEFLYPDPVMRVVYDVADLPERG